MITGLHTRETLAELLGCKTWHIDWSLGLFIILCRSRPPNWASGRFICPRILSG
jgi:hypothetical protein